MTGLPFRKAPRYAFPAVLFFLAAPAFAGELTFEQYLELGNQELEQSHYPQASEMFEKALAAASQTQMKGPGIAEAYAGLAASLEARDKKEFAIRFYRKCLELDPGKRLEKKALRGLKRLGALPPNPPPVWTLTAQSSILIYNNAITGSNPSASFLTPGRHGTEELGFTAAARSTATGAFWETAMDGRETDDMRVETNRHNLKRFYTRLGNPKNDLQLGDFLASFTPYSLGTALKGARYAFKPNQNFDLTGVFGTPKANWSDLWTFSANQTVDRRIYGARASERFGDGGHIGANAVWDFDSRSRYNTTAVREHQKIFGSDWSLPRLGYWSIYGESSYSETIHDNPTTPTTKQKGAANIVRADLFYRRFASLNSYERVSPDYLTTGGQASPDLMRAETQNTLRFKGEPWRLMGNWAWFQNNLKRVPGAATSITRVPEGGIGYVGPDWRPTFSAQFKTRFRIVTSSQKTLRSRTKSYELNAADKLFDKADVSANYQAQLEDRSDGTLNAVHHVVTVEGGMTGKWRGFDLTPRARWTIQRDHDKVAVHTDETNILTASLHATHPAGLTADVGYSRNLVLNAVVQSSDRRSWNASIGYNILANPNYHLEGSFKQNDNRFSNLGQDFKEQVVEGRLHVKF